MNPNQRNQENGTQGSESQSQGQINQVNGNHQDNGHQRSGNGKFSVRGTRGIADAIIKMK